MDDRLKARLKEHAAPPTQLPKEGHRLVKIPVALARRLEALSVEFNVYLEDIVEAALTREATSLEKGGQTFALCPVGHELTYGPCLICTGGYLELY